MKISTITCVAFAICATSAFSMDEACRNQELWVISQHNRDRKNCLDNIRTKGFEFELCFMRATKFIAENACLPAMRDTAQNQYFLWQQLYFLTSSLSSPRNSMSTDEYIRKWKDGLALIEEEEKRGEQAAIRQNQLIESRAQAAMREDRILRYMRDITAGSIMISNLSYAPKTFNYIINNHMITCTQSGNLINCQ